MWETRTTANIEAKIRAFFIALYSPRKGLPNTYSNAVNDSSTLRGSLKISAGGSKNADGGSLLMFCPSEKLSALDILPLVMVENSLANPSFELVSADRLPETRLGLYTQMGNTGKNLSHPFLSQTCNTLE